MLHRLAVLVQARQISQNFRQISRSNSRSNSRPRSRWASTRIFPQNFALKPGLKLAAGHAGIRARRIPANFRAQTRSNSRSSSRWNSRSNSRPRQDARRSARHRTGACSRARASGSRCVAGKTCLARMHCDSIVHYTIDSMWYNRLRLVYLDVFHILLQSACCNVI